MRELIVVAAHGPDYITQCRASLPPDAAVLVVDTGSGTVPDADVVLPYKGYATSAYLWAYEHTDADRWLFIQDSMTALVPDPVAWFREQHAGGAVAWQQFPMSYSFGEDGAEQIAWVTRQYPRGPEPEPTHGILGPVFYTDRSSLDQLREMALLPHIPTNRNESCGAERAWAYAFTRAGLPVTGPEFVPPVSLPAVETVAGPFRKTWGSRP